MVWIIHQLLDWNSAWYVVFSCRDLDWIVMRWGNIAVFKSLQPMCLCIHSMRNRGKQSEETFVKSENGTKTNENIAFCDNIKRRSIAIWEIALQWHWFLLWLIRDQGYNWIIDFVHIDCVTSSPLHWDERYQQQEMSILWRSHYLDQLISTLLALQVLLE